MEARIYTIGEAAEMLGVSVDTARRLADAGDLRATRGPGGHRRIAAATLARFIASRRGREAVATASPQSARNRFPGIVTKVVKDTVVASVEIQAGPHRIVSLMTREAADELGLVPGVRAIAIVKATNVVIEAPRD